MTVSGLGRRINELVKKKGLTQFEFADLIGTRRSTFQRWIKDDDVDIKTSDAVTICEKCNVSLDWLLKGSDVVGDLFVSVPVYRQRLAAGHGAEVEDYQKIYDHGYRKEFAAGKNYAKYRVTGSSQYVGPSIKDRDTVLVDHDLTKLEDGKFFVFDTEDGVIIKQVELHPDGSVILKSRNPEFEPIRVKKEDRHTLKVKGKVIEATSLYF